MVSLLRTCATAWLSLIAGWCLIGATHRGQQGTPALTLPHVCDGLSVLQRVFYTFRGPSMCRPVRRQFMRNELLDLSTIVPATACYQRNYVEPYSRFIGDEGQAKAEQGRFGIPQRINFRMEGRFEMLERGLQGPTLAI